MAGLVPAIHDFVQRSRDVDARHKAGHDEGWFKDKKMLERFGENLPAREVKFAPCDLKRVEADGTFAGYASLFGEVDLGQDLVMPGACRDSLRSRGTQGVKLLFQHDPNEPIGVWLELYEDAKGLFARGRLMPEVARAREVLSLMRAGALDGLSIGFRTVKGRTDPTSGVRRLDKIDLWEISIVTFPMLPEARVSTVKRRGMRLGQFDPASFARSLRRGARVMRAR
jgi:HK97 family phage prohead protease